MRAYTIMGVIIIIVLGAISQGFCEGKVYTIGDLANAIYWAEGGEKASHAYGILAHYKNTSDRQACINTIHGAKHRYIKEGSKEDFILYLSRSYCPIGAKNDPTGLNVHWVKNVRYFLNRGLSVEAPKKQKKGGV